MRPFAKLVNGTITQNVRSSTFGPRSFATKVAVKNLPFSVTVDHVKSLLGELKVDAADTKVWFLFMFLEYLQNYIYPYAFYDVPFFFNIHL
jgi:hypothetical protein